MLKGGSTAYMRPLPGADRMYPETDILSVPVTEEYWNSIATPELLTVKAERFVSEYGLDPGMAHQMAFSEKLPLFERAVSEGIRPVFAARTILASLKELSRAGISEDDIPDDSIIGVMKTIEAGNAAKEAVLDILTACAKGMSVSDAVSRVAPAFSREELQDLVHNIVSDRVEFIRSRGKAALGPVMGIVMNEVRGRIDGKVVSEVLNDELGRIV